MSMFGPMLLAIVSRTSALIVSRKTALTIAPRAIPDVLTFLTFVRGCPSWLVVVGKVEAVVALVDGRLLGGRGAAVAGLLVGLALLGKLDVAGRSSRSTFGNNVPGQEHQESLLAADINHSLPVLYRRQTWLTANTTICFSTE